MSSVAIVVIGAVGVRAMSVNWVHMKGSCKAQATSFAAIKLFPEGYLFTAG